MNILFLCIGEFSSINSRGIYPDLMRQLKNEGNNVHVCCCYEKRVGKETELVEDDGAKLLHVKIGNITKCGMIEKGISTLRIESQYKKAIKKYFNGIKFDLIIYSTPPITFAKVIEYLKKRDGAKTYLLLKDIFPQNAIDIGVLKKSGIKGLLYKYFRKKEKKLYAFSDKIGCMSQANVDYVLQHNPEVDNNKVEICPNCIDPVDMSISKEERIAMREKYGFPLDKKVFVYGGNLGRPQSVPFIVECLKACADIEESYFVIAGSGADRHFLEEYVKEEKPKHLKLLGFVSKDEYDKMIACCDVGLIFLDYRFTIPNFPSRLLSYMQAGLPVLACTDPNTDVGKVIVEAGFGWWCESSRVEVFAKTVKMVCQADLKEAGKQAWKYMNEKYTVRLGSEIILESTGGKQCLD